MIKAIYDVFVSPALMGIVLVFLFIMFFVFFLKIIRSNSQNDENQEKNGNIIFKIILGGLCLIILRCILKAAIGLGAAFLIGIILVVYFL